MHRKHSSAPAGGNPGRPKGRRAPGGAPRGGQGAAAVEKQVQRNFLRFPVPPIRVDPGALLPPPAGPAQPGEGGAPFADLARELAAAKAQLDAIPPREFERLSRTLDLLWGLKRAFREEYRAQISTNATLKMYELLTQLGLLACAGGGGGAARRVRAFCNAELPGAFLVAINHYARSWCPDANLDWVASSYNPEAADSDTILGDQYGLLAGNRERWFIGPPPNALPAGSPPLSGDVTDPAVVAALAGAVHEHFDEPDFPSGATLYTSDAGIHINDYSREEEETSLLNFGQVLCGILSLASGRDREGPVEGGCLVTKQFTFLSAFSRSLIALLAALFDEVSVVKPVSSRPLNSEVYVVAKGFRGIGGELAEALLGRLAFYRGEAKEGKTPCDWTPLLDPALCADVDAALLRAARQIHGRLQVAFLDEAARFHGQYRGRLDQLERALQPMARGAQEAWLAANPAKKIRVDQQLAQGRPAARGK